MLGREKTVPKSVPWENLIEVVVSLFDALGKTLEHERQCFQHVACGDDEKRTIDGKPADNNFESFHAKVTGTLSSGGFLMLKAECS